MRKAILILSLSVCACAAPKVAFNRKADFSKIQRVAAINFSGPRGDIASDFMSQNLIAAGFDVIERKRLSSILRELGIKGNSAFEPATARKVGKLLGVDALISGSVIRISDAASYIINTGEQSFSNISEVSNSNIRSEGSVIGAPNTQVITTAARVSIIARMMDVETGTVLWSASMTYEGFDAAAAMDEITSAFAKNLSELRNGK